MAKPHIKLTKCESGDWEILEADIGGDFRRSGHSIPDFDWIALLNYLGYEVEEETISDKEMENRCC